MEEDKGGKGTHKTCDVSLSDLLNGILHLV